MLWLALDLPAFPLQVALRGSDHPGAVVITTEQSNNRRVLYSNSAARKTGIHAGMRLSTAYTLCQQLHAQPRAYATEHSALNLVADLAYQINDQVYRCGDKTIAVEIASSRKLFGSSKAIVRRLQQAVGALGYHCLSGIAPSLEAARLFARKQIYCRHFNTMQQQFSSIDIQHLPIESAIRQALGKLGIANLAQLLKLPQAALQSRFGSALTALLDDLSTNSQPARYPRHQPADTFEQQLCLPSPVSQRQALLFAGQRLFKELEAFLSLRDAATQTVHLSLSHQRQEQSVQCLRLTEPDRSSERWLTILKLYLERLQLNAPITGLQLSCDDIQAYHPRMDDLFTDQKAAEPIATLWERLNTRMGEDSVVQITPATDHRPEYSQRVAPVKLQNKTAGRSIKAIQNPACQRPLWLLPKPVTIDPSDFTIAKKNERIETGWWDNKDSRRDYYIATDRLGRRLWIFKQYKPKPGWYLHGLYG